MIRSLAAVTRGAGQPLVLEEVLVRPPAANEVLVEMKAAGLCHTDLYAIDGASATVRWPMVLGHEGAGIVLECGPDVTEFAPGDHVLPFAMPECGVCPLCNENKPHNFCAEFAGMVGGKHSGFGNGMPAYVSLGTFSQFATLPAWSLSKIRADVPFELATAVSCGVATGVGAVLFTAKVTRDAKVVVFGLGGVGLSAIQGARIAGAAMIIGIDLHQEKDAAGRDCGMTHFINSRDTEDVVSAIRDLTGGGADFSFECAGNILLLQMAFDSVRPYYGVCTAVGMASGNISISAGDLMMGKRLIGTMMGGARPKEDLPKLIDYYFEGKLDLESLVSHRLPFSEINDGFNLMRQGKSRRTVVTF